MKLATFRQPDSDAAYPGDTFAAVITSVHPDDPEVAVRAVALPGCRDVGEHLTSTPQEQKERVEQALRAAKEDHSLLLDTTQLVYDTLIPFPTKVICVGLNYVEHRREGGHAETAAAPPLFIRYPQSQVGHLQPMVIPRESDAFDFEAEIAVVIGTAGRRIARADAMSHVAGISAYNDGSVRDWQLATNQWTPGKNFPATGGFGPWLVTPDETSLDRSLRLVCRLNGETMQDATTDLMMFDTAELISHVSTFCTLEPGDVIVTGTPGGVGHRREPKLYMKHGDIVEIEVEGVGTLRNPVVKEAAE